MKKYTLEAVVEGRLIAFHKQFKTRDSAMNYIFDYYYRHLVNFKVNDEYFVDENNRHDIAYVYNYDNRFRIIRA